MTEIQDRQHPLFASRFRNLGFSWLANQANRFLSAGGMCYFINDGTIKTRLILHNYFAFLSGRPFHIRWVLRIYSTDGKRMIEKQGTMMDPDTQTIEMEPLVSDLGPFGLCMVHLYPAEGGLIVRNSYMTHYFIEYYTDHAESLMHSCGHPVPKIHQVTDYITSSIEEESQALLLVSNSCQRVFRYPKSLFEKGVRVRIKNSQNQWRHFDLEPILPLGSIKVDLRHLWPDLNTFLDRKPALIQVCGPNVLYSPLLIQTNAQGYIAMDHIQGGDWDDVDVTSAAC